jgi:diaminohydroxyphosphoribosylaminopyrimidine deaminase/5-amino-6-(5-phosphoribosylamino)uracil reductase
MELARLGAGSVSPNPMVGSVITCDGRIIGEGYHQRYGGPHAEVQAIRAVFHRYPNAEELLKRSVMYVSLEPCSHTGKTPPCADLIIQHQLPKVVLGARDPFPAVDGKGISRLRAAGIEVVTGTLEGACIDLNKRFFTGVKQQRPYIILKWAQTANGLFAPADRSKKWITGASSKRLVHKWRSEEDAVLIGKNTALADDPEVTVRDWKGRNPIRIVIDRRLELPASLKLFNGESKTLIINEIKDGSSGNLHWLRLEEFDHYLPQFLAYQLYLLDIRSLIVEGGKAILELFIRAGLWDEARVFEGMEAWENGVTAPRIHAAANDILQIGGDRLVLYRNGSIAAI